MVAGKLTIEITGATPHIPVNSFLRVTTEALHILQDIDVRLSEKPTGSLRWHIVDVSFKSPLSVTLFGEPKKGSSNIADRVVRAYLDGFDRINQSAQAIPDYFTPSTLAHAKKLVSVLDDDIQRVRFISLGRSPVSPTQHVAANVDSITRPRYTEMGTLEGRLEVISVHGAQPAFNIYDPLTGEGTVCYFPNDMLEEAIRAFNKRVAVYGTVKYSRSGKPVSIQVAEIRRLREQSELPQARDLEGIDITGGQDPTGYIRSIRDAE